jgi:hypothetical protein
VQRAERSVEANLVAEQLASRGGSFDWSAATVAVSNEGWSVTVPTEASATQGPVALVRGGPAGVTAMLRVGDDVMVATKGKVTIFPLPSPAAALGRTVAAPG